MKRSLLFCLLGLFGTMLVAQDNVQVLVVGLLKTDRTFHRGEELLLETRARRDQIIYAYDAKRQQFVVKQYVSESGYGIWDGERTIKEKHKTRTPRFSNRVPRDKIQQFLADLTKNVDSLLVNDYFIHTSHYYLSVFVSTVIDGDTTTWHKSQPFELTTPWHSEKGTFLNPAIDAFVADLLPKKFIGRDVLIKPRVAESDPTSMFGTALRVSDRSGTPQAGRTPAATPSGSNASLVERMLMAATTSGSNARAASRLLGPTPEGSQPLEECPHATTTLKGSQPKFRLRDSSPGSRPGVNSKPAGLLARRNDETTGRVFMDSPTALLLSVAQRSRRMSAGTPTSNSPEFEGIGFPPSIPAI